MYAKPMNPNDAQATIATFLERKKVQGQTLLLERESKQVLALAGIPTTLCQVVKSVDEALETAKSIGYPVVLKGESPAIVHKTDLGAVLVNLKNEAELKKAYEELYGRILSIDPNALVTIQKMALPGVELALGAIRDAQFGPVIMAGMGGILVELYRDVSFRMVPLGSSEVLEMLEELKGYRLLTGYRGLPPANLEAIVDIVLQLSDLIFRQPFIEEIDINPVIAGATEAVAVDARIVLQGGAESNLVSNAEKQ